MRVYVSPMTEVYLLFLQSAFQVFVFFNKLLQREDSILSVLLQQTELYLTKLFPTVSLIKDAELMKSTEVQTLGACVYYQGQTCTRTTTPRSLAHVLYSLIPNG